MAWSLEPEKDNTFTEKKTTEKYTVILELCKHHIYAVKEQISGILNHLKVNYELVLTLLFCQILGIGYNFILHATRLFRRKSPTGKYHFLKVIVSMYYLERSVE